MAISVLARAQAVDKPAASPAAQSRPSPLADANFFPLAVWLQSPSNAPKYKELGINVYVGLWRGPSESQLESLKQNGMYVVCSQNEFALSRLNDSTILAWMHGDEPDNAQQIRGQKGYGPPILPAKIVENYQKIKQRDPSRPVLLNLGQGVAWDNYIGRGVRRNHPEDYPEYIQGCDIASFDIYPAVHDKEEVAGKLWFVADGVSRLKKWSEGRKLVWNCIECTHIENPNTKATPKQVKAEVWMSLVRGSQGLIYFVHQFKPRFVEAGLLEDPEMCGAIRVINEQIQRLAPVLKSNSPAETVKIESPPEVPVEALVKRHQNSQYVFAVAMRNEKAKATFRLSNTPGKLSAKVLGEDRVVTVDAGVFQDEFEPWGVHLYEIRSE